MPREEHRHKWEVFKGTNKLICHLNGCETVSAIDVLLANTVADTRRQTKIDVLSSQLFARELKKDAHDAAYAWVRANSPEIVKDRQGVLI